MSTPSAATAMAPPIDTVTASKKIVNVKEQYNIDRLRPHYKSFEMKPLFIMTSEVG